MAGRVRYLTSSEARDIQGGIAVVVDVIRAFTTAAWAFHGGVECIVMTDDLEEALRLKSEITGSLALKDGVPAPGFDLTNSPAQMRRHGDLRGRTIVARTTNGTVGATMARRAHKLYCASFVCASATAAALRGSAEAEICFVVTGEGGKAEEDLACAEFIAALILDPGTPAGPYVERVSLSSAAERINGHAGAGIPGFDRDDVALCLEVDRFDFTLQAAGDDGLLVLRRVPSTSDASAQVGR